MTICDQQMMTGQSDVSVPTSDRFTVHRARSVKIVEKRPQRASRCRYVEGDHSGRVEIPGEARDARTQHLDLRNAPIATTRAMRTPAPSEQPLFPDIAPERGCAMLPPPVSAF